MLSSCPCENAVSCDADVVQLSDPAAVEQQRQRAEDLLDLDAVGRTGHRDRRVVRRAARWRLHVERRPELDVLLAEQASSAGCWRSRCSAGATLPLTSSDTSAYLPSLLRSILVTRPTATPFTRTPDCGTRSSASRECGGHGVRVVADVGTAGQGHVVEARCPARSRRATSTAHTDPHAAASS